MTEPRVPLPHFVIIGAQKSATRWLRSNLGEHPEVYAPDLEPSFFNSTKRFERYGLDWYRDQFRGWDGEPVVGEATPGYLMWGHDPAVVAGRIAATLPDVRLLAILRNPVDRAQSALLHHKTRERVKPAARLLDVVRSVPPEEDPFRLVTGGWYASSLSPYVERFGDHLLVQLFEDVESEPTRVFRDAQRHVGVDPAFLPDSLDRVVFSNRSRADGSSTPSLTADERLALWPYFAEECRRLEELLDLDLSGWDPGDPTAATADPLSDADRA